MSIFQNFLNCVEVKDGKTVQINCKLGLWSVSGSSSKSIYADALHYWQQHNEDGEYYRLIGGDNPSDKFRKSILARLEN